MSKEDSRGIEGFDSYQASHGRLPDSPVVNLPQHPSVFLPQAYTVGLRPWSSHVCLKKRKSQRKGDKRKTLAYAQCPKQNCRLVLLLKSKKSEKEKHSERQNH